MSERRRKLLTRIVVGLIVLWFVGQIVLSVVRYVNDRKAHQEAEAWLQQAQQAVKPDLSEKDAVRWLEQNGAERVYRGGTSQVDGRKTELHVIMGSRTVSEKSFWSEPLTAELTFHFDTNWHFTNLDLKCRAYTLKP